MNDIKIDYENSDRNLNVNSIGDGISNINLDVFKNDPETLERPEDIGIGYFANQDKRVLPDQGDYVEDQESISGYQGNLGNQNYQQEEAYVDYEEVMKQKAYYLSQLSRLEKRGNLGIRRLGMEHSLDEIKGELIKIKKEAELEYGVGVCKNWLLTCVSTLEFLNTTFDPIGAKLDGWTLEMNKEKDNYDEVFEELYEKYAGSISTSPEIKLILMIAGSGAAFHLKKSISDGSLFGGSKPKRSGKMKGPSINTEDLLKKMDEDSDSGSESEPKVITVKKRGRKKKNV
jgi:hypothetical protein